MGTNRESQKASEELEISIKYIQEHLIHNSMVSQENKYHLQKIIDYAEMKRPKYTREKENEDTRRWRAEHKDRVREANRRYREKLKLRKEEENNV